MLMAHDPAEIALMGETASQLQKQLGQRQAARLTLDIGDAGAAENVGKAKAHKQRKSAPAGKADTKLPAPRTRKLWYLVRGRRGDSEEMPKVIEAAVAAVRRAGPAQALKVLGTAPEPQPSGRAEPATPLISDYKKHEAQRWAETREAFLAEYPSVPAPKLAELTGSKAKNPSARAHSWAKAGRIFSVNDGAAERFPLFQFLEDKPLPAMAEILEILRSRLSNWQIALWLTTPNAWVGEWRTPISVLTKQPEIVIDAARHEVAEKVL